ncbi:MAG: glycosyltransferase [Deltaproteobacteria bacterium]|nr:glycosyltransferase [Deltaproteobacteria bacterium]
MEILSFNKNVYSPKVSIILLDWSCRESFHILRYLANQTIPRDEYEVIWIEYYDRRSSEIEVGIKESDNVGKTPLVDQWIVMDMPQNIYYHKHLMYNIGILLARGKIVTFCDSDTIVAPTFIESIIKSFEEDTNIVLHMDEARNNDKRFYPFNYPSIEEVIGQGCINWKNGKTTGLLDKEDPFHTRNYGACMSALREDLINIGGADEHIDYLGHICGPYEMTFRLINAGKKEVWHQEEFLYHVWHPGQAGQGNYLGPHDGKHVSTTALQALKTGRILPLVENPAIKKLRQGKDKINPEQIFDLAIPKKIDNWDIERLEKRDTSPLNILWEMPRGLFWEPIRIGSIIINKPVIVLGITRSLLKMLYSELMERKKPLRRILQEVYRRYLFLTNINKYNERY